MKPMTAATVLTLIAGMVFATGAVAMEGKDMHQGMTSDRSVQTDNMQVVTVDAMNLHSADQFIGTDVKDRAGQDIGKVTDLMVNFEKGRVGYAVVSSEDGKKYLVPLNAFSSEHEGSFVTLQADRNQLATSPQPQQGMTEEEYGRALHEHYGVAYPWDNLPGDTPVTEKAVPGSNLTYPGPRDVVPSEKEVVQPSPPGGPMDKER